MSRRLSREEIKLAARFVVELLELQARKAPESELEGWRARVKAAFPDTESREVLVVTIGEIMRSKGVDLEKILGVAA